MNNLRAIIELDNNVGLITANENRKVNIIVEGEHVIPASVRIACDGRGGEGRKLRGSSTFSTE